MGSARGKELLVCRYCTVRTARCEGKKTEPVGATGSENTYQVSQGGRRDALQHALGAVLPKSGDAAGSHGIFNHGIDYRTSLLVSPGVRRQPGIGEYLSGLSGAIGAKHDGPLEPKPRSP